MKNDLGNQYTLSYDTENIEKFQEQLHCIMFRLSYVSQEMIDVLYEDMESFLTIRREKLVFITNKEEF